eukprot:Colp12_sorted_trinity150504_noHs@34789
MLGSIHSKLFAALPRTLQPLRKMQTGSGRGSLIVFEGIDRCGKSTQCKRLVESLNAAGKPAELWRFPERTTVIGQQINAYLTNACELDDHVLHLLFSANRWELVNKMKAALNEGKTVVVDRYAYSGVVFSSAKGLDFEWCKNPDSGLPEPDVTIFLEISVEEAMKRGGFGEERYEKREMQEAVAGLFKKLYGPKWKIISALQTPDALATQIFSVATETIEKCTHVPLTTLWPKQA